MGQPVRKKPGRPPTEAAEFEPLTVRFPSMMLDRCREVALQESRSLNAQILYIMKKWYAEDQRQHAVSAGHSD
jgi:hypothetical protein